MLTPGDMDGDGGVGSADVLIFADVLLGKDANPTHVGRADVNCSGVADGLDVQEFINHMLN